MPPGSLKPRRYRFTAPRSITNKSGALRWGEQVRREIEAGRPPPQSREGKAEAATQAAQAEEAKPNPATMTLREAAAVYLEDCAGRGSAAATMLAQRNRTASLVPIVGDALLATAGEAEASRVRTALQKQGLMASTINQVVGALHSIIARMHALGLRETPAARLGRVRDRRVKEAKAYDDPTFEAIVMQAAVCGPEHLAIVLVCGEAGLRVGELRGLEVRDFDAARGLLHVERSATDHGEIGPPKNGEVRVVPLSARVVNALGCVVAGRPGSAPIFLDGTGQRMSRMAVRFRLNQVQRLAGLPLKGIHTLRHTCATSALAGGADVVAVQRLLGHRNLQTTVACYLHDTGDAPTRALTAITSARAKAEAGVTDLARLPRSTRKPRKEARKPK